MSHPAASVTSILSGKMNLDPRDLESPEYDNSFDDTLSRLSNQNLLNLNQKDGNDYIATNFDSTNGSVVSDIDYDNKSINSKDDEIDQSNLFAPSLSRNSTTSCLSTTATKDGIEGRKLHRRGPNPYTNQVITTMLQRWERLELGQRPEFNQKPELESHNDANDTSIPK